MNWKSRFLIRLCRLLSRWIPRHQRPGRFLVVSTTALGDSLWATPALQALRASFPSAHIALLTSPIGEEVLRHNPWTNEILVLQEPLLAHFFSLAKTLWRLRCDTALLFHASQRLALPLCVCSGAGRIVGTFGINKGLDPLLSQPLFNQNAHEIVRRLEIIEAVGARRITEALSYPISPTEVAVAPLFEGQWIALHPGAKDPFKRWPPEHFVSVGRSLAERGYSIAVSGSKGELPLMEEIAAQIPGSRLFPSNASLRHYASLLRSASLLISNDTGPAHLAAALNIPVLSLFSPTDPTRCGPRSSPRSFALFKPPTCQPCLHRKCRRPFCMMQIGPEEVVKRAVDMIEIS